MSDHPTRRQINLIDRLVASRAITPKGRDFLINSLDPYHDTEIDAPGYPDITSAKSVVQVIHFTETITKPSTLPPGNWDLHMFNVPISPDQSVAGGLLGVKAVSASGNITAPAGLLPNIHSGFSAIATVAGAGSWNLPSSVLVSSGLELPSEYATGRHRLYAFGYEAHDTTAELYRQGAVITYRKPSQTVKACFTETGGTSIYDCISLGASNMSDAAIYPNSRTWEARDGVYAIATLNDPNCPVTGFFPGAAFGNSSTNFPIIGYGTFPTDSGRCHAYSMDITGSIFTGLQENASITVSVRYLIERFPDSTDRDLVVLAKPSPAYDPLVLEIYARACQELPPAVKVGENPLGEWFGKVLNVIGAVAPAIGNVLPGPLGLVLKAGGRAASAAGNYLAPQASSSTTLPASNDFPKGAITKTRNPRRQSKAKRTSASSSKAVVRR